MSKISVTEVRKQLRAEMKAMALHYQAPVELDERFEAKLKALPAARTEADRGLLLISKARLLTGYQTHLLAQWAKGNIEGPRTKDYLLDKAKSKEGLARMLIKKGQNEAALKQMEAAEALRAEANDLDRAFDLV